MLAMLASTRLAAAAVPLDRWPTKKPLQRRSRAAFLARAATRQEVPLWGLALVFCVLCLITLAAQL